MLTLWYSHDDSKWYQAENDNETPLTFVQMAAARRNAIDMAKRFHSTVQIRSAEKVLGTITKDTQPAPNSSKLPRAVWRNCPGLETTPEDRTAHMMLDHCWTCAPFWERFPACPQCNRKLMKVGKTKCKHCQTFILVENESR